MHGVVFGSLCSRHCHCSSAGIPSSRVDPSKAWDKKHHRACFFHHQRRQTNKLPPLAPTNGPRQLRCTLVSGRAPEVRNLSASQAGRLSLHGAASLFSLLLNGWLSSLRGATGVKGTRMEAVWQASSHCCREAPEPEAGRDFFSVRKQLQPTPACTLHNNYILVSS